VNSWQHEVFERMIELGYDCNFTYWESIKVFGFKDSHSVDIFVTATRLGNSILEYQEYRERCGGDW
jgi:hypothetical protein